jgi:GNAT superfamily N-acetyltransferase
MIRIAEYDAVDPLQVLHLNLLCLDFALTPEVVAVIRRMDPRPFPFFAIYAAEGRTVAGQVGVFRLPVVSTAGAAEVGGVWAVSTHPAWRGKGVASLLLDEAHARMAAAGLRFSTLGTDSYRVAHSLYEKQGYRDLFSPAAALGRNDALPGVPGLAVEPAGVERLALVDRLFEQTAHGRLGFARRHTPFFPFLHARSYLDANDLWLFQRHGEAAGYAVAGQHNGLLRVKNLRLAAGVNAVEATVSLAQRTGARYIEVRLDEAGHAAAFAQVGFRLTGQSWGAFMVKPLAADATLAEFRQSYGLDDGRFLSSYMDMT